jgi:hypothetical protein
MKKNIRNFVELTFLLVSVNIQISTNQTNNTEHFVELTF